MKKNNDIFYPIDFISECFKRNSIVFVAWISNQVGNDKYLLFCRNFNVKIATPYKKTSGFEIAISKFRKSNRF